MPINRRRRRRPIPFAETGDLKTLAAREALKKDWIPCAVELKAVYLAKMQVMFILCRKCNPNSHVFWFGTAFQYIFLMLVLANVSFLCSNKQCYYDVSDILFDLFSVTAANNCRAVFINNINVNHKTRKTNSLVKDIF